MPRADLEVVLRLRPSEDAKALIDEVTVTARREVSYLEHGNKWHNELTGTL
jgi:hypothetical protein